MKSNARKRQSYREVKRIDSDSIYIDIQSFIRQSHSILPFFTLCEVKTRQIALRPCRQK